VDELITEIAAPDDSDQDVMGVVDRDN